VRKEKEGKQTGPREEKKGKRKEEKKGRWGSWSAGPR